MKTAGDAELADEGNVDVAAAQRLDSDVGVGLPDPQLDQRVVTGELLEWLQACCPDILRDRSLGKACGGATTSSGDYLTTVFLG